ncbi:MAG: hypothetical protein ACRETX_15485, partial [Steroidobacteraceae bacterium]
GGPSVAAGTNRSAGYVAAFLNDERLRLRYSKAARALVDGRGACRVAQQLRHLMLRKRGTRAA